MILESLQEVVKRSKLIDDVRLYIPPNVNRSTPVASVTFTNIVPDESGDSVDGTGELWWTLTIQGELLAVADIAQRMPFRMRTGDYARRGIRIEGARTQDIQILPVNSPATYFEATILFLSRGKYPI